MHAPQIIFIILSVILFVIKVIQVGIAAVKNGHDDSSTGGIFIIGFFFLVIKYGIIYGLLIWGGFFSK